MDRALKERIVGAIVLVVFIVLVVPVFLDGPADDATVVSESVTLPGQNGQERKRQTIVLERDRSEPVPAAASTRRDSASDSSGSDDAPSGDTAPQLTQPAPAVADTPTEQPTEEPAVVAATPAPPPVEEAEPEPEPETRIDQPAPEQSATGMWAVQLGSFSQKDNAERLAAQLRSQGYAAFLSQLQSNGKQLHRVRIGPQKDRASAESVAGRLSGDGHSGQVVPHP